MSDKTMLVLPGRKMSVPRVAKRSVQIALGVGLTAALVLVLMMGNGYLVGAASWTGDINMWLAFIKRSDILMTMILTASVTVLLVDWQRDKEREKR